MIPGEVINIVVPHQNAFVELFTKGSSRLLKSTKRAIFLDDREIAHVTSWFDRPLDAAFAPAYHSILMLDDCVIYSVRHIYIESEFL